MEGTHPGRPQLPLSALLAGSCRSFVHPLIHSSQTELLCPMRHWGEAWRDEAAGSTWMFPQPRGTGRPCGGPPPGALLGGRCHWRVYMWKGGCFWNNTRYFPHSPSPSEAPGLAWGSR